MLRLILSKIGHEILRELLEEIRDARELNKFPLIRARIEWHEDRAAEWSRKVSNRADPKTRKQRRAYRRAIVARDRNKWIAEQLSDLLERWSR
jgi:hypothetical protein